MQDASPNGPNCIQLTPNINNNKGAAWHTCPLHLGAPFLLEFDMNFGGSDDGADGVCFVLQQISNSASGPLSVNGAQIGYGAENPATGVFNTNSLAIEIDTFANDGSPGTGVNQNDPPVDHIAIFRDGSLEHNSSYQLAAAVQAHPTTANIETGIDYPLTVAWDPETEVLEVYFAGSLRQSLTLDLVNDVFGGDPLVFWGFTASTGGLSNPQSFCDNSFYYSSYLDGLTVLEPAPWISCIGGDTDFTAEPLLPSVDAVWDDTNDAVLTVESAGSYPMTGFNANGCPTHEEFTIDVLNPDLQLLVDPNLVVCGGVEAALEATAAPGATIAWDGVEGGSVVTSVPGLHEVTATLGVCDATLQVDVTFQALPDVSFALGTDPTTGPIVICDGEPTDVHAVPSPGATASWQSIGGPLLTVSQSGTFTATSTVNGCESNPQSIEVQALPLAEGVFSTTPNTLCWGATGVVGFDIFNDASIVSWSLPSGTSNLGQAGAGTYLVELIHDNGCVSTESFGYTMLPPIISGLVDPSFVRRRYRDFVHHRNVMFRMGRRFGSRPHRLSKHGWRSVCRQRDLGACSRSDTAHDVVADPVVGTLQDSVSRCVLGPGYTFAWPDQSEPAVGTWIWTVNGEPATAGYNAFEEGLYTIEVSDNVTGCFDTHETVLNLANLAMDIDVDDPLICMGFHGRSDHFVCSQHRPLKSLR